ncbi:MAG: cytochrome c3 family protein [bacterium]
MLKNLSGRLVLVFLVIALMPASARLLAESCLECHSEWEEGDDAPSATFHLDVHSQADLGCSDCHGGNPELEDMDEVRASKGYRGVPKPADIPQFCAHCHSDPAYMVKHNPGLATDQLDKYKTSVHGKRLLEEKDTKVATCVSCHTAHRIEKADSPTSSVYAQNIPQTCAHCHADSDHMAGYGIPTDQYEKYVRSVHGIALLERHDNAAPACNDCHGNHAATPPGVTSLSAVCGTCHALVAENFASSPHQEAFADADIPQCEVCHSNHLIVEPQISWVGTGDSALCVECHSEDDGTQGYATAERISGLLVGMRESYTEAEASIAQAEQKGMMVVDEQLALRDVKQSMIRAATALHTFNADKVAEIINPGLTAAAQIDSSGIAKVDEYYFRRKGLGIASLLITILAIALFIKIRRLERR